ncbi:hypothetical protein GALMADRAFT_144855 [Galerina marginata CBS 339.88]|uniref:Protein-S-isoprenylcysteine O-methyltransferase n=1 Tax=Galerina marginata (strain CBS 339.88) TaxID=685588 RepID=A0A067SR58_GALM3|nr:hypothetical protein GALMADRAFT_144855 [Galerina marginata CBS 339.88]
MDLLLIASASDSDYLLDATWVVPTVQVCLLLSTAVSVHLSLSPPNPSVKSEDCCSGTEGTDTMFERFVQSITYCSKCMVWLGALLNIFGIVVRCMFSYFAQSGWDGGIGNTSLLPPSQKIHPFMIVGAFSSVSAAALRVWCFRSLGPFFTFEITIRPKHELVTHGPYAWVRHPSYTGIYLTLGGATLALGAPGTWIAEYGVSTPFGCAVACFWLLKCGFAFRGMSIRLRAEDQVLKETFGAEWEEYASRVPCKFIPGVI